MTIVIVVIIIIVFIESGDKSSTKKSKVDSYHQLLISAFKCKPAALDDKGANEETICPKEYFSSQIKILFS